MDNFDNNKDEMFLLREDITALRSDLNTHVRAFTTHVEEEEAKFDAMIRAIQGNTESVKQLTDETRTIITLYKDLQATARVGKYAQKAVVCVTKWGTVLAAIGYGVVTLLDKLPKK